MPEDRPAVFSRTSRSGDELKELRINCPVVVLSVLDAVAISEEASTGKQSSRSEVVNRILAAFVQSKIDEASLILKLAGDNPTVLDK